MARDLIWKSKDYLGNESNGPLTSTTLGPDLQVEYWGTHFVIKVTECGMCWVPEWIEQGKGKSSEKLKTTLACTWLFENHVYDKQMKFLAEHFSKALADSYLVDSNFVVLDFDIPCFTEIKVVQDHQAEIYRGHPAYRGEDPWHDWVNVCWKYVDGTMSEVPTEIQFFVT